MAERIGFGGSFTVGLSMTESQDYPVLGEVFTFLETVISTIIDTEVVLSAVQVCQSLLKGGIVFSNTFVIYRCCWDKRTNEYADSRIHREWNKTKKVWKRMWRSIKYIS